VELNSQRSSSVVSMSTTSANYCATTSLHATDKSSEAELWQSCPLFSATFNGQTVNVPP
jgi:hypothetical protein